MPTIYNKVTINGETRIDLSGDTVASAADIVAGKVGHLNTGATVTGIAQTGITPTGTKTISITENGTTTEDVTAYANVQITVNVPSSGSSKNVQIASGVDRVATTSYTAVSGQSITVAKTGTYDVYWTGYRSSTSGTSGSQLYVGSTAYGSAQTTFTNHGQSIHLSNVSLSQGDVVTVRARARGTSYYMYVGNLTIEESA